MIFIINGQAKDYSRYPGLVYRADGQIRRNPETPGEFPFLPLVDYKLTDQILDHGTHYLQAQKDTYLFMKDREIRSQVVDIGRGCVKLAGLRESDIPLNACDFCGIIPGARGISAVGAEKGWAILRNVFDQKYNYFYITCDELPLTLWGQLSKMIESQPDWYRRLPDEEKPKMFGYARAEAFAFKPERIDTLIHQLGFDHFFIGFDGLTEISLKVMNKQPVGQRATTDLMEQNLKALDKMVDSQGLITAGIVLTHLGITPAIMEENYTALENMVLEHPRSFAALDFGPLCPIPGSRSFKYLVDPDFAQTKADEFGLSIDKEYLERHKEKYVGEDQFEMEELIMDFVNGCCPEISEQTLQEYKTKLSTLCNDNGIVIGGGV